MATVKYDITDLDLDDAISDAGYEGPPLKSGVYAMKVAKINSGYSKDKDGNEDKSRPRLQVILETMADAKGNETEFKGHPVFDYVSFSKAAEWKLGQFLYAVGEVKPGSKKRKGSLNTDKIEGTVIKVRVGIEKEEGYEPRPRVRGMWPWDGPAIGKGGSSDDDLDDDLADDLDDADSEDGEDLLDEATIRKMKVDELKELAEEEDIDISGARKKSALVETIIEALFGEGGDDDDDLEEDDELDDEDDELEDEEPEYTAEDIDEMEVSELKALAKEQGVSLKGMKKSEAREALKESLGLTDDEDDDDVPF